MVHRKGLSLRDGDPEWPMPRHSLLWHPFSKPPAPKLPKAPLRTGTSRDEQRLQMSSACPGPRTIQPGLLCLLVGIMEGQEACILAIYLHLPPPRPVFDLPSHQHH